MDYNVVVNNMPSQKYRELSLIEKAEIIKEVNKGGKSKSLIAKEHGIPASTLSTFLKNANKILNSLDERNNDGTRKRIKKVKNPALNELVLKWCIQQRAKNSPLSGPLIQAKAGEFAVSLGIDDFKASSGWLWKFKKNNAFFIKDNALELEESYIYDEDNHKVTKNQLNAQKWNTDSNVIARNEESTLTSPLRDKEKSTVESSCPEKFCVDNHIDAANSDSNETVKVSTEKKCALDVSDRYSYWRNQRKEGGPPLTTIQALENIMDLRYYFECQENTSSHYFSFLDSLETFIVQKI